MAFQFFDGITSEIFKPRRISSARFRRGAIPQRNVKKEELVFSAQRGLLENHYTILGILSFDGRHEPGRTQFHGQFPFRETVVQLFNLEQEAATRGFQVETASENFPNGLSLVAKKFSIAPMAATLT